MPTGRFPIGRMPISSSFHTSDIGTEKLLAYQQHLCAEHLAVSFKSGCDHQNQLSELIVNWPDFETVNGVSDVHRKIDGADFRSGLHVIERNS